MKHFKSVFCLLLFTIIILGCNKQTITKESISQKKESKMDWKKELDAKLKLYGHRNWIVVADAAYPQQSNPAIETITIAASQLEAVAHVSSVIAKATHVDANIFVDKELAFVAEENAKGITAYRNDLNKLLDGKPVKTKLHEDIISELDASAKLFNVLIIKTDLAIPYTSVFFQLECGYWNGESEAELRKSIAK